MSRELEESEYFKFYNISLDEKKKIINVLREILLSKNEVVLAFIYGSILERELIRDIDIAVYVVNVNDYLDYKFELDKELSLKTGFSIDVKILNNAPPWFVVEVCRRGKLLFSRTPGFSVKICKKALEEQEALIYKDLVIKQLL